MLIFKDCDTIVVFLMHLSILHVRIKFYFFKTDIFILFEETEPHLR